MMKFNRGHMTIHMIGQTIGQLWVKIQDKFKKDTNGLFYNERLEQEQLKRKAFTDSRKNNIKGTNQHTKITGHMTSHMEDGNEDVIESKKKEIPSLIEFLEYAKESCVGAKVTFEDLIFSIESKYNTWVADGWKDGHKNKIMNWKNKFNNTLPHLKSITTKPNYAKTKRERFDEVNREIEARYECERQLQPSGS